MNLARVTVLPLLLLLGCGRLLTLPEAPTGTPPRIDTLAPAAAHAGSRLTIEGAGLSADGLSVQVGRERARVLERVSDTRLVVEVPEDAAFEAADVDVSIESMLGRTEVTGRFRYLGAGRLKYGRLTATLDLRPDFDWIVPTGPRGDELLGALASPSVGIATSDSVCGDDSHSPLLLTPGQVAVIGDGSTVAVPERRNGKLLLRLCGARKALVELGPAEDGVLGTTLAVASNDGNYVAVLDDAPQLRIVDLREEPPTVVTVPLGDVSAGVLLVTAYNQHSFALDTFDGIRRVVLEGDDWTLSDWPTITGTLVSSVRDCVAVMDGVQVRVVDIVYGVRGTIPTLGDVVFSEDCRLAVVIHQDSVIVYKVGDPAQPELGIPLDHPTSITRVGRSYFAVAVRGGVALLSQLTGALVEFRRFDLDLSGPVLRRAAVPGEDGDEATADVVELASGSADVLYRLYASTLTLVEGAATVLDGQENGHVVSLHGAGDGALWTRRTHEGVTAFRSVGTGLGARETVAAASGDHLTALPDPGDGPFAIVDSAESSSIALLLAQPGQPPVRIPMPSLPTALMWHGDDVAIVGESFMGLADAPRLRAGTLEWRTQPLTLATTPVSLGFRDDELLAGTFDTLYRWPSGASVATSVPLPIVGRPAVRSPVRLFQGGRRAIALQGGLLADVARLPVWRIDDTEVVADTSLALAVPIASTFALSADGERLYVVDGDSDRVFLYQ